ncbi:MAG: fatty acid cis/trans isomerase, partial [Salibacteraceae bacterium]
WRQKEFFSVTDTGISEEGSLAMLMLEQKRNHPKSEGFYISEKDLTCSETEREIKKFFSENPHKGMPYGFPQLQEKEHAILMKWLGEGAQKTSSKINTTDPNIEKWETFLNAKSTKSQVMARYIYEHLFIAHIYFPSDTTRFYELIRSNTPPNQPIDIVATRYPFDTPEDSVVYYRLREITSTIVDKTHMPYEFSDNKMARYKSLFLAPKWNKKPYMPSYQIEVSANPFLAYDQIPANSRHNFLLDNAYFFMSTFIKGPVCKGQTALNVIHDHLWIMFLDPKYDLSVQNDSFLLHSFTDLTLPNQVGSYAKPAQALFGTKYGKHAVRYYKYRDNQYSTAYPNGMNLDFLWKDNEKNSSLLTVYRHFDSGSVHKGALGDLPRTLWVVDFPVLERIYYSLVAGFDVFSGTTQQVMIREYMNRLRIESESNFLDFLPEKVRKETFDSWYLGTTSKMVTNFHTTNIETAVKFETNNYKEEFASLALKKFGLKKDPINYSKGSQLQGNVLKNIKTKKDLERAFSYLSQSIIPSDIIAYDIEYINLAHMRIKMENGEYLMYSMVVNRWHNNVSFLLNEDLRLDAEKDRLNFIEGFIGSYPNIYFDIEQSDLADFFDLIANYDKENEAYYNEMRLFSINRSNPKFWEVYDWFQNKYNESDRLNSGLFDLNRYYPHAR